MSEHGARPATSPGWAAVLSDLRADALDCQQTSFALVCDQAHGAGEHLRLGARWNVPQRSHDGGTTIGITLTRRLSDATELLGVRAGPVQTRDGVAALASVEPGVPTYFVSDAFRLPWLPYAGHQHLEHSFLVERSGPSVTVVDGYHNDTPWGPARPGVWTMPAEELSGILGREVMVIEAVAGELPAQDQARSIVENEVRARAADIDDYVEQRVAGTPSALAELVLDVWLLTRERQLHAYWLGTAHPAAERAAEWVAGWQRLALQSFVSLRRVERGEPANAKLGAQLHRQLQEDVSFAEFCRQVTIGAATVGAPTITLSVATVTPVVEEMIAAALSVARDGVHSGLVLRSLPGFDSFRLIEIIDRVEERLGLLLPADVGADELRDVGGLCRAFARGRAPT